VGKELRRFLGIFDFDLIWPVPADRFWVLDTQHLVHGVAQCRSGYGYMFHHALGSASFAPISDSNYDNWLTKIQIQQIIFIFNMLKCI